MSHSLTFGAGIWHFATYVDRYATDGYGPPVNLVEAIHLAGQVKDLSVVDLTFPFTGGITLEAVDAALQKNRLGVIGITPEIYTREFCKGAFTNPDPGIRRRANELVNDVQATSSSGRDRMAGIIRSRSITRHYGNSRSMAWASLPARIPTLNLSSNTNRASRACA